MIKKIKLVIVLLLCSVTVIAYTSGCSGRSESLSPEIAASDSEAETDLLYENDISEKLSDIKEKIVSSPTITSHLPNEELRANGECGLIFVKGYADKGCKIEVYVNGILELSDIAVDNNGCFETYDGIEIIKGENTVELVAVDPTWGKSEPTKISVFLDTPKKIIFKVYDNPDSLKEIESIYFSKVSNPFVYIDGECQSGSQVFLQVNGRVVSEYKSEDGTFLFENTALNLGANEIAVWSLTDDGYASNLALKDIMVSKDAGSPNPSDLSGYIAGDGNHLSWTPSTDENFSSYKIVRIEDPCANPEYFGDDVIATLSDASVNSYIDNEVEEGRSYFYTVWTLDEAGYTVSSNVLALPKPVYSVSMEKIPPFEDVSAGRREWFYRYYEITNTGNITLDLQPMMAWIKLNPEPDEEMELSPLWEIHIWNPDSSDYYYSDESIYSTHVADWANVSGTTETETEYTYNNEDTDDDGVDDYFTKTATETTTTKKTSPGEGKRIMTITITTTRTVTDRTTGAVVSETTTTDTSTKIVEPEKIGSLVEGLEPGGKVKIAVKVQNISAGNQDTITFHFHFAPVDCGGHYFTDEIVSTGDVTVKSSGRS